MPLLSELGPGRNAGVKPSDVTDLNVSAFMSERVGHAAGTTGGFDGDVFIVDTLAETGPTSVRTALAHDDPLWVVPIVAGAVNLSSEITVTTDKTLDGRGGILIFDGKRLSVQGVENVILCNAGIRYSDNDGITFRQSDLIWCDHLSLTACGDGLLDISRAKEGDFTARHTISWCKFTNHNKASIAGLHNDAANNCPWDHYIQATYHHNWFDCIQRQPRVSRCQVHAYNNVVFMDQEGMQAYDRAKLFIENNWFRKTGDATACVDYEMAPYPDGRVRSVGNVFSGGATNVSWNASGVALPDYEYTAEVMNAALYNEVVQGSGARLAL